MNETTAPPPPGSSEPPPAPAPPPFPGEPVPRRLTRHPGDKVIGGVAGGLGRYFGIDPIVFRLAFVAFALFGGGGVLLYLIAWVAMPAGDTAEPVPASRGSDLSAWIGLALVLAALLMFGGALFTLRPGFVAALVLLAGGFLLFQHSSQERGASSAMPFGARLPQRPDPAAASVADVESAVGEQPAADDRAAAPGAEPAWGDPTMRLGQPVATAPVAPPPRAPRSRLGRVTLAALFLSLGVLGFLHATAVVFPEPGDYAALALGCVGAGLLAGAWWGRARWLIPVGVLLIPVALVTSLAPRGMDFDSGAGEVSHHPLSSAELRSDYELGAGQLTLDLTRLRLLPGERRRVAASIGAGELVVVVPPGLPVTVHAEAGVGDVDVFGVRRNGLRPEVRAREVGGSGVVLDLDLSVGLGQIRVVRAMDMFPMGPFGEFPRRPPFVEVF